MEFVQFLPVKIESVLDWSLIVAFVGGISFYFGKIMNEVYYTKENKYSIYNLGTVFIAQNIILPILVIYTVFQKYPFKINSSLALIILFIISGCFGLKYNSFRIETLKKKKEILEIVDKQTKEIISHNKTLANNATSSISLYDRIMFRRIPNWFLFTTSLILIWLSYCVIVDDTQPIIVFISLLLLITSLSVIAILQSWNSVRKYPLVRVHLNNGEKLEGDLTKIEEGFININNGNKIYHIIDSNVLYIEKDISIETKFTKHK
jgi:hypothetical protein